MKAVKVSPSTWIGLAIVAGARVAKGDEFRTPEQNRGAHRNRLNDLVGCIGEYAVIVAAVEAGAKVSHDLFDASGPLKRADLVANGTSFDAKALLLDPSRKYFILDRQAVAKAEAKGITAFVPVVARRFGDRAVVGNRITVQDAKSWALKDFGYGSAHALPLANLAAQYFGMTTQGVENATGFDVFGDGGEAIVEAAFVFGAALRHGGIAARIAGKGVQDGLETLANEFAKERMK
jgi:hypothetical protein